MQDKNTVDFNAWPQPVGSLLHFSHCSYQLGGVRDVQYDAADLRLVGKIGGYQFGCYREIHMQNVIGRFQELRRRDLDSARFEHGA